MKSDGKTRWIHGVLSAAKNVMNTCWPILVRRPFGLARALVLYRISWQLYRMPSDNNWAVFAKTRLANFDTTLSHRFILTKDRGSIKMEINKKNAFPLDFLLTLFGSRPAVILGLFSKTDARIRKCVADVSDGREGGPGIIGFCASHPDAILVPDSDFFCTNGHEEVRRLANSSPAPWHERSDTILWRGSTTGDGLISSPDMASGNAALLQRTRLCLALRDVSKVDAKYVSVVQTDNPNEHISRLQGANLMGSKMGVAKWLEHKFAIDIDGNSNAWSNLFQCLLLGCCVIKICSPRGYRQWYYNDLKPWKHYVPVQSDLSDLLEAIEWCRENQPACAEIAAAGRTFAIERTFEREMEKAVRLLEKELPFTSN